jgi:hypothetical protein
MRHQPSTLPKNWQRDPEFAERVYQKIDQMIKAGAETRIIAEETGVSYRTVLEFRKRGMPNPNNGYITDGAILDLIRQGCSGYELLTDYGVQHRRFKRIKDSLHGEA